MKRGMTNVPHTNLTASFGVITDILANYGQYNKILTQFAAASPFVIDMCLLLEEVLLHCYTSWNLLQALQVVLVQW